MVKRKILSSIIILFGLGFFLYTLASGGGARKNPGDLLALLPNGGQNTDPSLNYNNGLQAIPDNSVSDLSDNNTSTQTFDPSNITDSFIRSYVGTIIQNNQDKVGADGTVQSLDLPQIDVNSAGLIKQIEKDFSEVSLSLQDIVVLKDDTKAAKQNYLASVGDVFKKFNAVNPKGLDDVLQNFFTKNDPRGLTDFIASI